MSTKSTTPYKQFTGSLNNEDMLKVLQRVSNELFDVFKFKYWHNVIISGGYVLDLLFDTNTGDDIDMFIYNANKETISAIYKQITTLTKGTVDYETGAVVTLNTKTGKKLQLINTTNKTTAEEVVSQFDINPCKVYFDGYNLRWHPSALEELKTRTIDLSQVYQTHNSQNRITKYVQHKGWKLGNLETVMKNIDPLFLFKECQSFDKMIQNLFLINNDTLSKIYDMIFIRKNQDVTNIKNKLSSNYCYSQKQQTDKTHKNIGLSSQIELRPEVIEKEINMFGLPKILYKIKCGNYKFEELYDSLETDICGFNVACYVIMYESDENRVIEYFNNSEKFTSKNLNKYNLSYVELSALLNKLKLVKFFLNKNNFKKVMEIAVHEDNVELYKMTYKLISSEERYMFKKDELLRQKAYTICEELYGELNDRERESEKERESERDNISKKKNKYEVIDNMNSIEEFIKYYYENISDSKQIMNYLVSKSVKQVVGEDLVSKLDGLSKIEKLYTEYSLNKIKQGVSSKFNLYLANITQDEKEYSEKIKFVNKRELTNLEHRYIAIRMSEGYLSPMYKFDVKALNQILVLLDDIKLVENNKNKKEFFENVLTIYTSELGPNFTEYMKKNYERVSSIKYYSKILSNTEWHDSAYDNCVLEQNYKRQENAIGYTPDDIIMFKTINDYCNGVKPNFARSQSVKNIDREKKLEYFAGEINATKVKEVIPETFDIEKLLESVNNNQSQNQKNNKNNKNKDIDWEEIE
jgi:hypothetical protein